MKRPTTLVFLITGFLDSGKTTFIESVVKDEDFTENEKSLIILTEEGEYELDEKEMAACRANVVTVDDEDDFTTKYLEECGKKYQPKLVFIEYNGMWDVNTFLDMDLPEGWMLNQVLTMVDATTFEMYMNNMRSMMFETFKVTEMIFFNRCTQDMPLTTYRRNIRAVNRRVQIGFEDEEGNNIDLGKEELPYDINADLIEIEDEDFGILYMDMMDEPEKYDGKMLTFTAKVYMSKEFPEGYFVPGRHAMTCCADDIRFIGFACKTKHIDQFKINMWVKITAVVKNEYFSGYKGNGPVLYLKRAVSTPKPEDELVYFN